MATGHKHGDVAPQRSEPSFWFGFEIAWAKLEVTRFVLFALLAGDALLQIRHAPRYGAGGFNVAHVPWLEWLTPSRAMYGTCELVNAYLFVFIACGVATRWFVPITTAIYSALYFTSQLDSYQHHYLLAMILVIACFVPWQQPANATAATPVRSWAVRLMLVELGIVYLWAAISKLDLAWLSGGVLRSQLTGSLRAIIDHTIGFKAISLLVVAVELTLAATVWCKPAWKVAAPLGILLHLGIAVSGLEIGLFAWLMIAFYALVVPDSLWIALRRWSSCHRAPLGRAPWLVVGVSFAGSIAVATWCRFPATLAVAIAATVAVGLASAALAVWAASPVRAIARLAVIHLVAVATWWTIDHTTTIAADYYKFWGRSARRFSDSAGAEIAYRDLIQVAPNDAAGHYQLGRLLLERGAVEGGLAELHVAQRLGTQLGRAYVYEARWLASHGQLAEALAKARAGAAADPTDHEASQLVTSLQNAQSVPPSRSSGP